MVSDLSNIRKSISEIAKLLNDKDLADYCGGNISARDGATVKDLEKFTKEITGLALNWER